MAAKIASAAKNNARVAEIIATYGRGLSLEEAHLHFYYEALDDLEAAMNGKRFSIGLRGEREYADMTPEEFQELQKQVSDTKAAITEIFIEAVNNLDGDRIMRIATAVRWFRDKRPSKLLQVDRERTLLLFYKTALEEHKRVKPTIRQVAQFLALEDLAAGKKLVTPADGWSALRRKCKQVGLKLEASRKRSYARSLGSLNCSWPDWNTTSPRDDKRERGAV